MENDRIQDLDQINDVAENWVRAMRPKMIAKIQALDIKGRGLLARTLRIKSMMRFGTVDRIAFKFPRHGVFVEKGVGRGTTISMAKSGTGKRTAKSWLNSTIDDNIVELADDIEKIGADIAVNAVSLKIN